MADPASECVFCAIARGGADGAIVASDETTVAFLDRRPLFPGHVLLVPREHVVTLEDLPDRLVEPLFARARELAVAVRTSMDAEGTFVAMNNTVSQSVAHLHVHIVPRRRKDGLRGFFWPRNPYDDDAHMHRTAQAIAGALETAG